MPAKPPLTLLSAQGGVDSTPVKPAPSPCSDRSLSPSSDCSELSSWTAPKADHRGALSRSEPHVLLHRERITTHHEAADLLRTRWMLSGREELWAVYLGAGMRLVGAEAVAVGQRSRVELSPRDFLRRALLSGGRAVIMAHNHPSGVPLPSTDDLKCTLALAERADWLGLKLLDHLILTQSAYCSLSVLGLLPPWPSAPAGHKEQQAHPPFKT